MESIFSRVLTTRPPTLFEQIRPEIAHLEKSTSVRHGARGQGRTSGVAAAIAVCAMLGLYFMDPFIYAMQKYEAMQTYLYLHNYDGKAAADNLLAAQIFSRDEIESMNHQQGVSQNYFASPQAAEQKAASIVAYVNGVRNLHAGNYERLDPIGKLRYLLFVRTGLIPPTEWSGLNPSVD